MFGTKVRNEKGEVADACSGDSGKHDFSPLYPMHWNVAWIEQQGQGDTYHPANPLIAPHPYLYIQDGFFWPGGPLIWKSPAPRFVLIGTVQGTGFNCRYIWTSLTTVSLRAKCWLSENTCFKELGSMAFLKAPIMAFGTRSIIYWLRRTDEKSSPHDKTTENLEL